MINIKIICKEFFFFEVWCWFMVIFIMVSFEVIGLEWFIDGWVLRGKFMSSYKYWFCIVEKRLWFKYDLIYIDRSFLKIEIVKV